MSKGCYCQGQQLPGPEGAPQGFVRGEDGKAGYYIIEFVDGKLHGHFVSYDSAGNVQGEGDFLLGKLQR